MSVHASKHTVYLWCVIYWLMFPNLKEIPLLQNYVADLSLRSILVGSSCLMLKKMYYPIKHKLFPIFPHPFSLCLTSSCILEMVKNFNNKLLFQWTLIPSLSFKCNTSLGWLKTDCCLLCVWYAIVIAMW